MLLKGYVPHDGAQHKTVVEMTSAILGDSYRDLTGQFETMRRKRNIMTYEAGTLLSKSESQRAFSDAIELVQEDSGGGQETKFPTLLKAQFKGQGEFHGLRPWFLSEQGLGSWSLRLPGVLGDAMYDACILKHFST